MANKDGEKAEQYDYAVINMIAKTIVEYCVDELTAIIRSAELNDLFGYNIFTWGTKPPPSVLH